ncbi:hypothetical protein OH76DRAFT_337104 [Lentinus brumalis]|uniref:Uncharacterized protein n=1 Tax=Lentinus brumalis TaxID=2498619 RepID=A0A371CJL2_9APHY|nr:hypothetical protein OH76DRAFT_337104 [Polyporus brumalis]
MEDMHRRLAAGLEDANQVRHSPACSRAFASPRTRARKRSTPPYRCMRLRARSRVPLAGPTHIYPHSDRAAGAGQDRPRIHVSADPPVRRVDSASIPASAPPGSRHRLILTRRHRQSTRYLQGMPVARIRRLRGVSSAGRSSNVGMQCPGVWGRESGVGSRCVNDTQAEYLFPQHCCTVVI